uniref:Uncharacterized protein n=1 Tax=Rhizophora mucronata TaxID=61149 RepID=A0A2P2QQK9_RHIMU
MFQIFSAHCIPEQRQTDLVLKITKLEF